MILRKSTSFRQSIFAAVVMAVFLCTVPGNATTLDISGFTGDGASPLTSTATLGAGSVTAIEFNFNVESPGISWGSEIVILIEGPGGFEFSAVGDGNSLLVGGAADVDFGFGTGSFNNFSGSFSVGPVSSEGEWSVTTMDDFDDEGIDYVFGAGSYIELVGGGDITGGDFSNVPEPNTMILFGIGLLGLARINRRKY